MKIIFCLFLVLFAVACYADEEKDTIRNLNACTSTPGCLSQCKSEIIALLRIWTVSTNNGVAICGRKVCEQLGKKHFDCGHKFLYYAI